MVGLSWAQTVAILEEHNMTFEATHDLLFGQAIRTNMFDILDIWMVKFIVM